MANTGAKQSREVHGFERKGCHCEYPVINRATNPANAANAANRGTAPIVADSRSDGDRFGAASGRLWKDICENAAATAVTGR
jgi:hypothetical protein